MTDTYTVAFRGNLAPGNTLADVRQRLQDFFRLDDTRADQLFSGRPVAIGKNIELDRAQQLRDLLAGMGALVEVRSMSGLAVVAARPAVADAGEGLAAVTVEPPGADVLRPEERRPVCARAIVTDHLSVDRTGGDLLKPDERKQPAVLHLDLSHLEIEPFDLEAIP